MTPERDMFLRLRPLLPTVVMIYLGGMMIAAPFFLKTYYGEVFGSVGSLIVVAAIVMYFTQHVERRIEDVLKLQGRLADAGIDAVGVVDRHNMSPLAKQVERGFSTVIVNREDSKLLVDLLRLFDEPRYSPRRVVISDWAGHPESHEEQAVIAWVRDLARDAEFRVSKRRATNTVLVSDRGVVLMSPISRDRGVYLFSALSRWSKAGDLLTADVEQSWSEAAVYEQSTTAMG